MRGIGRRGASTRPSAAPSAEPPPPDPDALEARVGFWSDNTLWQAQANKSYALELNGVPQDIAAQDHRSVWVLVDVDGVTGGFNFMHCWCSGFAAGTSAADIAEGVS